MTYPLPAPPPPPEPEISIYRKHCVALLRRYFSMSIEVGRLPAILGRELFTTRVEDFHVHSFEDTVLFVIDVERCLERLHPFDQELIAHIVLQEYTEEEAARLLHCTDRTIRRRLPDALDFLSDLFLRKDMLNINERVPDDPLCDRLAQPCCSRRMPQYSHPGSKDLRRLTPTDLSQTETSRVKPPVVTISLQAAAAEENIFLGTVSGLPPQICYAGNVS